MITPARYRHTSEFWKNRPLGSRQLQIQPHTPLIPAKAGIQGNQLGPRFRGDEWSG